MGRATSRVPRPGPVALWGGMGVLGPTGLRPPPQTPNHRTAVGFGPQVAHVRVDAEDLFPQVLGLWEVARGMTVGVGGGNAGQGVGWAPPVEQNFGPRGFSVDGPHYGSRCETFFFWLKQKSGGERKGLGRKTPAAMQEGVQTPGRLVSQPPPPSSWWTPSVRGPCLWADGGGGGAFVFCVLPPPGQNRIRKATENLPGGVP